MTSSCRDIFNDVVLEMRDQGWRVSMLRIPVAKLPENVQTPAVNFAISRKSNRVTGAANHFIKLNKGVDEVRHAHRLACGQANSKLAALSRPLHVDAVIHLLLFSVLALLVIPDLNFISKDGFLIALRIPLRCSKSTSENLRLLALLQAGSLRCFFIESLLVPAGEGLRDHGGTAVLRLEDGLHFLLLNPILPFGLTRQRLVVLHQCVFEVGQVLILHYFSER